MMLQFIFFQEDTVTNSAIWLFFLHGPDFLISAHGHGNAYVSFCPFIYKVIEVQKLFSKLLFIKQENWKTKAFFSKQIYITIFK